LPSLLFLSNHTWYQPKRIHDSLKKKKNMMSSNVAHLLGNVSPRLLLVESINEYFFFVDRKSIYNASSPHITQIIASREHKSITIIIS